MRTQILPVLLLLSATIAAAADPGFLLGVEYSEWLTPNIKKIATDASGAIYILSAANISGANTPPSTVTKLSSDGKTIVWQNALGIAVSTMAVDPNGGVYVTPINLDAGVTQTVAISVAKLNDNGSGIAWTFPTGLTEQFGFLPTLAADSGGRAYVAGFAGNIVRITASGTAIDYQQPLAGMVTSIAVNASGAAFATGSGNVGFITRFAPDGTPGYSTFVPGAQGGVASVVLDANGNPVVYSNGTVSRFDANGALTSSKTLGGAGSWYPSFTLDQAGNAYVLGSALNKNQLVKNTLAPCGTEYLSVVAPDGSVLQTTYLPGSFNYTVPAITMGKDNNVLIAAWPSPTFAPTRTGPLAAGQFPATSYLLSLSTKVPGETFALVCIANGGGYLSQSISPGQVLVLYGNGLGPQQGVQPQATLQSPYPTKAGDVEVTFDGIPAPLLWVQDGQINVVAPWALDQSSGHNAQVCASYQGVKSKCISWPVVPNVAGVFVVDGGPYAVALNQDGSVNTATNPAPVGTLVSVFATGLGPISPTQPDGSLINFPLPVNNVPPTVDGVIILPGRNPLPMNTPAEVTYAGPAPYRVAGISQINFRLLNATTYQVKMPGGVSQFQLYVSTPVN